MYACDKRQLKKKEIKELKLNPYNDLHDVNVTIIKQGKSVEIKRGIHERI